jgi:hypothetical protein
MRIPQRFRKMSAFYATGRSTTDRHWNLTRASGNQSSRSHSISLKYIYYLTIYILVSQMACFPKVFQLNFANISCFHMLAICHVHLILFDFIAVIITDKGYKLWNSSNIIWFRRWLFSGMLRRCSLVEVYRQFCQRTSEMSVNFY